MQVVATGVEGGTKVVSDRRDVGHPGLDLDELGSSAHLESGVSPSTPACSRARAAPSAGRPALWVQTNSRVGFVGQAFFSVARSVSMWCSLVDDHGDEQGGAHELGEQPTGKKEVHAEYIDPVRSISQY